MLYLRLLEKVALDNIQSSATNGRGHGFFGRRYAVGYDRCPLGFDIGVYRNCLSSLALCFVTNPDIESLNAEWDHIAGSKILWPLLPKSCRFELCGEPHKS